MKRGSTSAYYPGNKRRETIATRRKGRPSDDMPTECNACTCKGATALDSFDRRAEKLRAVENRLNFVLKFQPGPTDSEFRGDVCLVGSDGGPVYAHRFILAGRSTVFRRMFETEMLEKESGTIHVEDASINVLRSLVKYLYTMETEFTEEAPAEELLKLADKYDIEDLKAVCEEELCKNVNMGNFLDRLVVAKRYNSKRLDTLTASFLVENLEEASTAVADRLSKQ
ncbi:hypothetical protein R1sor_000583 [Riccia sorocarpa]|uniref:BTB domain-containing protein n=1 Tax=Riccia sorocarpa TaxID=122646 RepID=A0ABD3GVG2_9MARC